MKLVLLDPNTKAMCTLAVLLPCLTNTYIWKLCALLQEIEKQSYFTYHSRQALVLTFHIFLLLSVFVFRLCYPQLFSRYYVEYANMCK